MGKVIWYTGLPCSGKTTNAKALKSQLEDFGKDVEHLDGDVIRNTPLAQDAGFTEEDREKHIRKMGQLAHMLSKYAYVICSFVSPSKKIRNEIRGMIGDEFVEVYMKSSSEEMIERDTKGMYAKALRGEIKDFTGISAPYESPDNPEVTCDGVNDNIEVNVNKVLKFLGIPSNSKTPHLVFFGRWCPLHKGHIQIIKEKMKDNPNLPILVFVRDTSFDKFDVYTRADMVRAWMQEEGVHGRVQVIPDIKGVYYGRDVGYEVEMVEVPDDIKGISGTRIREMISEGNDEWKEIVAPGVGDFIEKNKLFT